MLIIGSIWSIISGLNLIISRTKSSSWEKKTIDLDKKFAWIFLPYHRLRQAPLDSYLRLSMAFLGCLAEFISSFSIGPNLSFNELFRLEIGDFSHHFTIYFGFIIGSLIEIFFHYKPDIFSKKFKLIGILISFGVEVFLMSNHLIGKNAIDKHLHFLIVCTALGSIIFILLEIGNPNQVKIN